ncbi:MAG: putative toxin-antitoxin system toxin component, PIN family [Spirochaetaceae bacterium]|jgi:putative PIN family toxin of toxin-antitoxin system|nr:putative toxin-antitoxin system toxin component, PIN family [Spirochaetaceae bacterium]
MRIMADTNILFSSLLFPVSLPAKVLKYITKHHSLILCDYIIMELRDVIGRKRPDMLADIDILLTQLPCEIVIAPQELSKLISDPKDSPILNAAIVADVDIIISGDKHFLELDLDRPKTMSAAEFCEWMSIY